jgi:hypothetical protein
MTLMLSGKSSKNKLIFTRMVVKIITTGFLFIKMLLIFYLFDNNSHVIKQFQSDNVVNFFTEFVGIARIIFSSLKL